MPIREDLGLTTFVEEFEDGTQIHHSDPAIEVGSLCQEVNEAIAELGDAYAKYPEFANNAEGLGLRVVRREVLRHLPSLDYNLARLPINLCAHNVLQAFAKQLHDQLHDSQQPHYIRIMYSGPNSDRHEVIPLIWHTDALVPPGRPYPDITANLPQQKRLVVGAAIGDEEGNTEWLSGDILLSKPSVTEEDARMYADIFWTEPRDKARITRDGKSIIRLALLGEEPPSALVKRLPDGVIAEIGTTTVHRGVLAKSALRLSLQCYFEQAIDL